MMIAVVEALSTSSPEWRSGRGCIVCTCDLSQVPPWIPPSKLLSSVLPQTLLKFFPQIRSSNPPPQTLSPNSSLKHCSFHFSLKPFLSKLFPQTPPLKPFPSNSSRKPLLSNPFCQPFRKSSPTPILKAYLKFFPYTTPSNSSPRNPSPNGSHLKSHPSISTPGTDQRGFP